MSAKKQYNYCLDFLKGVACIFVVFMHCEFPGIFGTAVQAVSRFCVPFFFMVSGFFCYRPIVKATFGSLVKNQIETSRNLIFRKLKHVAKITFYASLFYFVFVLFQHLIFHTFLPETSLRSIFYWLIFNTPIPWIAGQYWFLFALLYVYAFYGILEMLHLRSFAYWLAAALFITYIVLAQGMYLIGYSVPNILYRNWLVEAFPFFMLGHWIHDYRERFNISNSALIIFIFITTFLCLVERWLLGRDFGVNIITIPQVFALFVYGVQNSPKHEGIIQRLGRNCSMLVYILHPAVWHSLEGIYCLIGFSDNMYALYMLPLLVLGFSISLSLLFNKLVAAVKNYPAAV